MKRLLGVLRKLTILLPAVLFLAIWQLFVQGAPRRQFFFGSPYAIIRVAVEELSAGKILEDIAVTGLEIVLGLVAGSFLGTVLGLLLWTNSRVGHLARPYITIAGSVPVFALAPMLIIWFGTGLLSKVVMAAFSTCLVSVVQAYEGARSASAEHIRLARVLGASRGQILRKIVVPSALTWVLAGFRLNIGFAVIGAFIGEFVSSERGLGHYILRAGGLYDIPRVLFGLVLLAALALALTGALNLAERWWFPWCRLSGNVRGK